jgi:spore maturation protein A
MNRIWCGLIIVGIFVSVITGTINNIGNIMIDSSMKAFNIFLQTSVLILFWGGLFQIAIDSGMVKRFSQYLKKPLSKIYKELDTDSYAYELICSNMVANILGLGAAATPIGLKAFKELQKMCDNKEVPSRSMLTFIIINCSSLTLFPTTIISLRKLNGGNTSFSVILMMIAATTISTFIAIILDQIFYKRRIK